jgi:2-polyprenyl-3-methyl-5-hydroxy-6-metoxy-1,4-benzoquinol methylase
MVVGQQPMRSDVPCARCGGTAVAERFTIRTWRIVDCRSCGLRFVSPRMTDQAYAEVYGEDYFKSADSLTRGYEDYAAERDTILATFRRRFDLIARHAPPAGLAGGRSLDVGCAFGYALEVAAEHGLTAHGVDISAHVVADGKARGLRVERGGVETARDRFGPPMRVVTSWDVIEHLPDPIDHLRVIGGMMEPGGVLSLITPDRGAPTARLFGARWVEYQKPEEHIYFFRREDMRLFLDQAGFEVVATGTAGKVVPLGFALDRLGAYGAPFRLLARLARPAAGLKLYVDPLDKMHLIAVKR